MTQPVGEQRIEGNRNVQIQGVVGSSIQITYNGATRTVPLEPAHVPVAQKLRSPARLIRAHAGVIPYVERGGLIGELETWIDSRVPFSGQVIGGRGGAGKTRLAVELCQLLEQSRWLCGFLIRIADHGMLESLVEAPTPRLVVVDYAETRPEQLELLLPLLSAKATSQFPVRVLILVRGGSEGGGDWAERLANRVDSLDAVLDECEVRHLEDTRFEAEERRALFEAAVPALAERLDSGAESADPPDLTQEAFSSPLMVIIAAYLAALGESAPATREALLDEVLAHEQRYWREGAEELGADEVLFERMVALATLLGASTEQQAESHLRLLPALSDAPAERRNRLARWVKAQYPGPRWWNPLEPDLIGEHLVARCFTEQPEVLRGALAAEDTEQITRSLEVLARAAADHPRLAEAITPVLSGELEQLCRIAIAQAEQVRDQDFLYGKAVTVAAALNALLGVVEVDADVLPVVGDLLPPRPDLVLHELANTLTREYVKSLRPLAIEDPDFYTPILARALNNLSNRLGSNGRHEEALKAIEESVQLRRPLAKADPATYTSELARALNNLSNRLADVRRDDEALAAAEESVELRRPLAEADPATYAAGFAGSLNNLSNRLANVGRDSDALAAIEEAVELHRPLAEANPAFYGPDLGGFLNNLSNCLANVQREPEALARIEEAVATYSPLAKERPAAYAPDMAMTLNNLSNRLANAGRHEEALKAIEQSVQQRRLLVELNPAAYGRDLMLSLRTFAELLSKAGREEAAEVAVREMIEVRERLGEP